MTLTQQLLAVPANKWTVRQVVAFDWYDGPRAGICKLSSPEAEFWFECVEEKYNSEGLDLRLCTVSTLQLGTLDDVLKSLAELGPPASPVWTPIWRFADSNQRRNADTMVSHVRQVAESTNLLICAASFRSILGCWERKDETTPLIDLLNEIRFED